MHAQRNQEARLYENDQMHRLIQIRANRKGKASTDLSSEVNNVLLLLVY